MYTRQITRRRQSGITWRVLAGVLALGIVTVGCGRSARTPASGELVILHTNDIHGKFRDTPATWKDDNPPIGGFSNLSAYVEAERAAAPGRTLLLDGGDLMTGNPICDYVHEGVVGGVMIELMNLMGYDAMALGNHEFDRGLDNLDGLLGLASFPILSANVHRPEGGLTAPARHVIVERNGIRVGIIGLTTEALYDVAAPSMLAGTKVTSSVEAVRELVSEIDADTDVIVLLTHVGVDGDRELARQIEGVDLIVGGHSHTRLREPIEENGILILQAGAHNRNLGRVAIHVENDAVSLEESGLIELWPREGGRAEIVTIVDRHSRRIDEEFGQPIGELVTAWRRAYHAESNIGNWITDAMRTHVGGDFAVLNSGGIRKDVAAGPITKLDVLEVLPFNNTLTTFTISGEELLALLRHNAHAAAHESHGILQMSGVRYGFTIEGEEVTIIDASIGGEPIDPAGRYTGVSVDYVTHGNAERLFGFQPKEMTMEGTIVSSVIMAAIERAGRVDARVEGRMVDASAEETQAG